MTSDAGRKTYRDLLETLRWICTRNEKLVAAMRDRSDRMAVTVTGMKVPLVIHSPPGPLGTNRGADLEATAPQGDGSTLLQGLDDVLIKVHSGRVRMTAIRCDGGNNEQISMPLAELNDLTPAHPGPPGCPGGIMVAIARHPDVEIAAVFECRCDW